MVFKQIVSSDKAKTSRAPSKLRVSQYTAAATIVVQQEITQEFQIGCCTREH